MAKATRKSLNWWFFLDTDKGKECFYLDDLDDFDDLSQDILNLNDKIKIVGIITVLDDNYAGLV